MYGAVSSLEFAKTKPWPKPKTNMKATITLGPIDVSSSATTLKLNSANKETSLSKLHCFKCQRFGHCQNACPNGKVVTLREAIQIHVELVEE